MTSTNLIDAIRSGICPSCGCRCLIAGPIGGASRNVLCPCCLTGWNIHGYQHGVIGVDRLGAVTVDQIMHAIETYATLWRGIAANANVSGRGL